MEKALIIHSVSAFIVVWGIAVVFLWFRPKIEIFWKIIATLIFLFYLWFFREEIGRSMAAFKADWYLAFFSFLKELLVLSFVFLFFIWPVVLFVVFYKADDIGAEWLLRFLCVATVILWIVFVAYIFYDKKIDTFLFEKMKTLVPFTHK